MGPPDLKDTLLSFWKTHRSVVVVVAVAVLGGGGVGRTILVWGCELKREKGQQL